MKIQQQLSLLISSGSKEIQKLQTLLPQSKATPCLGWDDMPDSVRFLIEDMLDAHPPKKSLCHDNCFRLCAHFEHVHVHTGYAMAPFLMEHSWCSVQHQGQSYFFDPTDLAHFRGTHFKDHLQLCALDRHETFFWAHALEHTGPFHHAIAQQTQQRQIDKLASHLQHHRAQNTLTDASSALTDINVKNPAP